MRVLIAEDDPVSNRFLVALLTAEGHEVIATRDGQQAMRILDGADAPPLAILDWKMPGLSGPEICSRVRARKNSSYVYLMIVTAFREQEQIVAALQAGADDFLTKPIMTPELVARLRTGERIVQNEQQLIAANEQLRIRATYDPLTGLWNRCAILEMLDCEMERARRQREPLSVCLLDIDHFKHINDTYGHLAGDVVLREVGKRLRAELRVIDGIGRYGGEEFLIVLPACTESGALLVAERLRRILCNHPISLEGNEPVVTASFGVSQHCDGGSAAATIANADHALYRAKHDGRNRAQASGAEPLEPRATGFG